MSNLSILINISILDTPTKEEQVTENKLKLQIKKMLFFLFLPLLLFAQENMKTRTQAIMGTFVDITLPLNKQIHTTHCFQIIGDVEHILSSYATDAHLYVLNKNSSLPINLMLKDALEKSIDYYDISHGYFDITIGSVTKKLYHFGEESASPSQKELQRAILNIKGVHINDTHITLNKNITLDLGGMGKGYGVDTVVNYLEKQHITEGKIAISGDIRCLDTCEFYLQSPLSPNMFAKLSTKTDNVSISTSGTYRRYAKSKEEHHLIDPKKRVPAKHFISVSLFAVKNNSRLDAFATAIAVMPEKVALSFLKKHHDISFILVKSNAEIVFNDTQNILNIEWLSYKERATIQTSSERKKVYKKSDMILTHPNISQPIEIKR